jgi:hypothetical protein
MDKIKLSFVGKVKFFSLTFWESGENDYNLNNVLTKVIFRDTWQIPIKKNGLSGTQKKCKKGCSN